MELIINIRDKLSHLEDTAFKSSLYSNYCDMYGNLGWAPIDECTCACDDATTCFPEDEDELSESDEEVNKESLIN